MKTLHKKRLLNVAKALRDAAKTPLKKFFTMTAWGYEPGTMVDESLIVPEGKCGTPACALGHYAARRDLQKDFALTKGGELHYRGFWYPPEVVLGYISQEHFGLDKTSDDAEDLFGQFGCGKAKTPIQAARYIEKFVKERS